MQRKTLETGPSSPEVLVFTADEAGLCVKAASYYVTSSLPSLSKAESYNEALRAILRTPGSALEGTDTIATFVEAYHALARKFHQVIADPEKPVELTSQEIQNLGFALFRFDVSGLDDASRAVVDSPQQFTANPEFVGVRVAKVVHAAYELFENLEPIAKSKPDVMWGEWDNPLPAVI